MKTLLLGLASILLISSTSFAEEQKGPIRFETGLLKSRQLIPYQQCWSRKEELQKILSLSLAKYRKMIKQAAPGSILLGNLADVEVEDLKNAGKEIQDRVDQANSLVDDLMALRSEATADLTDVLPDAFMVFGGGKLDINIGIGAGTSLMAGMVIMPYCLRTIDNATGEVERSWTVKYAFVGWGGPTSYGFGVGGGLAARVGVGAIWSLDENFSDPKQFHGFFVGKSKTIGAGVPLNLKLGGVKRTSLAVKDSFAFASLAFDIGLAAGMSWHWSNYAILPIDSLVGSVIEKAKQEGDEQKASDFEESAEAIEENLEKAEEEVNEELQQEVILELEEEDIELLPLD